jgi:hypothetical protein
MNCARVKSSADLSPKPVTCAHELSSKLDAPRRALTAALNARLTPQHPPSHRGAVAGAREESIDAPLMIVKGDGSLMKADDRARISGRDHSVRSGGERGRGRLSDRPRDFVVSDMGGTTTDIAVVSGGRPVIRAEGRWSEAGAPWSRPSTCAPAARRRQRGGLRPAARSSVGPRKAMPLSLLAHTFPGARGAAGDRGSRAHLPEFATQFAFRNPDRAPPGHLSSLERRVWDALEFQRRAGCRPWCATPPASRPCAGSPMPGS